MAAHENVKQRPWIPTTIRILPHFSLLSDCLRTLITSAVANGATRNAASFAPKRLFPSATLLPLLCFQWFTASVLKASAAISLGGSFACYLSWSPVMTYCPRRCMAGTYMLTSSCDDPFTTPTSQQEKIQKHTCTLSLLSTRCFAGDCFVQEWECRVRFSHLSLFTTGRRDSLFISRFMAFANPCL